MRRAAYFVLAVACSETASDLAETHQGSAAQKQKNFAACMVAEGPPAPFVVADETGRASVEVAGEACARSFTLTTTAVLRDELPNNPRIVQERAARPSLQTNNALFDALYQLALDEAEENSVTAIRDYAFNEGAPLMCPDGGCFETGRKWNYVWTRDTAYAADLGLAWVDPTRTKNSLGLKLSARRDGAGGPQIVQDTGTGGSYPVSTDRVVWALGAAETLRHLRGDERARFAEDALEALRNTMEHDRAVIFDARDGLYRGEQSFLDWREQTYPGWTVPDLTHIAESKSLSTNVGHLALLDLTAELAAEAGDHTTAHLAAQHATSLRRAIEQRFWLEEEQQLSTFLTTQLDPAPVRRYDLLGISLAVLLDAVSPEKARVALANYPTLPKGPPVVFPQQQLTPVYHNRGIWPFVTAYWAKAARKVRHGAAFDAALASLVRGAALNLSNMENFDALTGQAFVDEGPYSGPVVNSQRQLWSVAGYIGTIVSGVFGMEARSDGLRVEPFVTPGMHAELFAGARSLALNNVPLRGKTVTVVLTLPDHPGAGGPYSVVSRRLNGEPLATDFASEAQLAARNLFEIVLGPSTDEETRLNTAGSDRQAFYGPRTPSAFVMHTDGRLAVHASFGGEEASDVTWSVYRDGERVAADLPGSRQVWIDPATAGEATPVHCYAIETRFRATETASHHSQPTCFWGNDGSRTTTIYATQLHANAGHLVDNHGRWHHQFWGDSQDELEATFTAAYDGPHLVYAEYANAANWPSTGITCAVKRVTVEETGSGAVAGRGALVMPQRPDWSSWGESSMARVELRAGTTYRVKLSHDDGTVNMSAFEHFAAYTAGLGGRSGPFYRVNIANITLRALAQ